MTKVPPASSTHRDLGSKIRTLLSIRRAVTLVWASARGWTLASTVLIVLQGILPLATLYLLKLIIDAVTAEVMSGSTVPTSGQIVYLLAFFCALLLITVISRSLSGFVSEAQSALTTDYVQSIIHAKSVEVDLEYYENPAYYDAFYRAQAEAPVRPTKIVNGLVTVGQSAITVSATVILLVSFNWILAILLLAAVLPVAYVRWKYADRLYQWRRSRTSKERQSYYFHWMLTGDSHAKEIRLFNLGPRFIQRYRELRKIIRREFISISGRKVASDIAAQVIGVLALFIAFVLIAFQTIEGSITLGDLVLYFGLIQQSQSYMSNLLTGLAGLYEDTIFLANLNEFLDLHPKVTEPEHPLPVPVPMKQGISFEHVNFRYPGSGSLTLSDISFYIPVGETVAFVGENGSGKTTLIKLLCRLYDPESGKITLDGIDIRMFSVLDLRREISIIFQDYARYNLTARENIIFGTGDRPVSNEEVERAAEAAGADSVIAQLDQQYETILGKMFEKGAELSIGEWQKIALARAFIRDAQMIVMDEPTSSLDPLAEADVLSQLQKISEGCTTVIISHRLSSVKRADCIYFMKGGMIVEQGTHDQLLSRDGGYAKIFETQARQYR